MRQLLFAIILTVFTTSTIYAAQNNNTIKELVDIQQILDNKTIVMVDRTIGDGKCLIYFADSKKAAKKGEVFIYVADCKLYDKLVMQKLQKESKR